MTENFKVAKKYPFTVYTYKYKYKYKYNTENCKK